MSSKSRKIYLNISTFVILLSSWWAIGSIVSREAVQNDGRYIDVTSFLLAGSYYNDWLPVITALAFGSGWGTAALIAKPNKANTSKISLGMLISWFIFPVLCFLLYLGIKNLNQSFADDFIDPSLLLFLSGVLYGTLFGHFQRMEKDTND